LLQAVLKEEWVYEVGENVFKEFRGFDIPLPKYITIRNLLTCKKFMNLSTAI